MSRSLVLLDGSLIDRSGHAYEYDRNVIMAFAAQGWDTHLFAHRKCVLDKLDNVTVCPWFTYTPTDRIAAWRPLRPPAKLLVHWWRSGAEIRTAVEKTDGVDTVFFVQQAESYHLPALLRAFRRARGRLLLMLRATSLGGGAAERPTFRTTLYRLFLARLSATLGDRLILVTDSARLQAEYRRITGQPIALVPIPNPPAAAPPHRRSRKAPLKVLLAGRMSFEKGIQFIPPLVRASRARGLSLVFHVHLYHHPSEAGLYEGIRAQIESLEGNDVVLTRTPLATDVYWSQMREADAVLLFYDVGRYRNQTSGLLLDALACGSFPIVTERTWLSDIVSQIGFGAAVPIGNEQLLIGRTLAILSQPLLENVPDPVRKLLAWHTADSFCAVVSHLLSDSP